MGNRSIDVERLSRDLELLVCGHRLKSAHVVQAVCYLDEDDAYIVVHSKDQLSEILRLGRYILLILEHLHRDLGKPLYDLGYLVAKHVADVLFGVLRVLYYIVQECRGYRGGAKSHLVANDIGDRYGVHDVGLSTAASYPCMRFIR